MGPDRAPYSRRAMYTAAISSGRQNSSALSPREKALPASTSAIIRLDAGSASAARTRSISTRQAA